MLIWLFLLGFLPCLLLAWRVGPAVFEGLTHSGVLLILSLCFYAFWGLPWLLLLICQSVATYLVAQIMGPAEEGILGRKRWFVAGLAINLVPLFWFNYAEFLVSNLFPLLPAASGGEAPPGISFYTLIQIAWLSGIYAGKLAPPSPLRYLLFSTCFAYILYGPLVRYQQTGEQLFTLPNLNWTNLACGLSLLIAGLGKVVLLGGFLTPYVNAVFQAAEEGAFLQYGEAWIGSFCYTFQFYFVFSGYTDVARGSARLLGLDLPQNFNSPYKATGFIEFWQRWNITLGNWLLDFVFLPVRGRKGGHTRTALAFCLTVLLCGLWYGGGWTFIAWGVLQGLGLTLNYFYRKGIANHMAKVCPAWLLHPLSVAFTFLLINLCWVVFRCADLESAARFYASMFLLASPRPPLHSGNWFQSFAPNGYLEPFSLILVGICLGICWLLPNTQHIFQERWRPDRPWAYGLAILLFVCLLCAPGQPSFSSFPF